MKHPEQQNSRKYQKKILHLKKIYITITYICTISAFTQVFKKWLVDSKITLLSSNNDKSVKVNDVWSRNKLKINKTIYKLICKKESVETWNIIIQMKKESNKYWRK